MDKRIRVLLVISILFIRLYPLVYGGTISYAVDQVAQQKQSYKVLEIQPSRHFELTASKFHMLEPTHDIHITQMSMKEFISKAEVINGTYDLVYIGNHIVDDVTYEAVGSRYPEDQNLPHGEREGTEYYSNNDITDRRAKVLVDYIESGQLLMVSSSIYEGQALRDTKLYKHLLDYKSQDNVVAVDSLDAYFAYTKDHGNGLLGQYFNYPSFRWGRSYENGKANSVYRVDETIDYNWGTGAPIGGINGTKFSAIWTGKIRPEYTEEYTFYTLSDDGVKLWVNGKQIINKWNEQSVREHRGKIRLEAGKFYDIRLEYFDRTLYAEVHLKWSSESQEKEIVPKEALFLPRYNGLKAAYYNYTGSISDIDFPQDAVADTTRIEPQINYYWGYGQMYEGLNSDRLAIRWTSQIIPEYSETYTFYTQADDGVRLWVGDELLIDEWHLQWNGNYAATISLEANKLYDIKMEYFEYYGVAQAKLRWSSPSQEKEIIPQNRFLLPSQGADYRPSNFYMDYVRCEKRPELNVTSKPKSYDGREDSYLIDSVLSFVADLGGGRDSDTYTMRLYLDSNGNGSFEEGEAVASYNELPSQLGYQLGYSMANERSGLVPWKLEVENERSGTKVYDQGYVAKKGEARTIKVLHLTSNRNSLHMDQLTNVGGQNLIERDGEYVIETTEMPMSAFSTHYPNAYNGKPTELTGNYDMVMIGFSDGIGGDDITNRDALRALTEYIETRQGVIISHDVLTFRMHTEESFGYHLTHALRDLIGQNIYANQPFNEDNPSYGFSDIALDRSRDRLWFTLSRIYQMNEGMITMYPFIIDSNSHISATHYQYFRLNMEEDIVPWYTLTGDRRINSFDGRNSYHTYTKDNITFTNIGHKRLNATEKKLLINVILKTEQGANHPPELIIEGLENQDNILPTDDSIHFTVHGTDRDGRNQELTVDVYLNDQLACSNTIISDADTSIEVPKEIHEEVKEISIKVVLRDADGASSEQHIQVTHNNPYTGPIITPSTRELTYGQVTLTYHTDEVYERMMYRIGETGQWHNYTGPYPVNDTVTVYGKLVDEAGQESTVTSYEVSNIDTIIGDIHSVPTEKSVFKISRFIAEYRLEITETIDSLSFQIDTQSTTHDAFDFITFLEAGATIRRSNENNNHLLAVDSTVGLYSYTEDLTQGEYIIKIPIMVREYAQEDSYFSMGISRYKTSRHSVWVRVPFTQNVDIMRINLIPLPTLL